MEFLGVQMPEWILQIVVPILILGGALLCLSAAVGLLHFRDVPSRLHAATKPQVLGLLLIALAFALAQSTVGGMLAGLTLMLPVLLMQFATAPLSAHMVGRQAYRNGYPEQSDLLVDELAGARENRSAAPPRD